MIVELREETLVAMAMSCVSPREAWLLDLLSNGLTNKQIAAALDIQYASAKTFVSVMLRRLGFDNRFSAAQWWIMAHLLTDPVEWANERRAEFIEQTKSLVLMGKKR